MSFEFKKAKREKVRLRIAMMGSSGSGKTLGALYVAQGITGDWNKIAFIDTEQCRSLLYANRSDLETGEFLHCNLEPPYTVERYCEAIKAASEVVGDDGVIIIDSLTHAWKGEGGVLDAKERIAQQRGKTDFSAWADAGKLQNHLVDTIMGLDCHVIVTIRSKTAYAQEVDPETGKTRVRKLGLEPDQRNDLEYEFSTVFDIDKETHCATIQKDNTFLDSEGFYGRLTPEIGRRLKEWVDSGVEPVIYTCECCGKKIKSYAFEDGTVMSPQEIVEKSKETYGKEMCMNCCIETMQAQEEQEEENVEQEEE